MSFEKNDRDVQEDAPTASGGEVRGGASKENAIHVTKAIVPDPAEYAARIAEILSTRHLTNSGAFATNLENTLCAYLGVPYLALCANGTLSLIMALRAAKLQTKEVITTPFSYVASVSALLWEGFTPVFADIDEETLCLDPRGLEDALSDDTVAVLPVHIYGNACDVESIGTFAQARSLPVIYDAAQAFGSTYNGKSLLAWGDFAVASFHATKVFHTVEGGGVVVHTKGVYDELKLLRAFGHTGDTHYSLGINAKMTEPHAAMGLCLLGKVRDNIAGRKRVSEMYDALLPRTGVRRPVLRPSLEYNYAYYPVIFDSEAVALRVLAKLHSDNIFPRRYFFPALNTLPYLKNRQRCPIAEDIAPRVLSLPLYTELEGSAVERIIQAIKQSL